MRAVRRQPLTSADIIAAWRHGSDTRTIARLVSQSDKPSIISKAEGYVAGIIARDQDRRHALKQSEQRA